MKRVTSAFALFVPLALVWACGSSGEDGNGGSGANGAGASAGVGATQGMGGEGSVVGGDNSGATSSTGGSTAGNLGTGGTVVGAGGTLGTELCGDAGCVCSNGLDDDDDGVADGLDPECTGPYDDDEGSFATGISGDNKDPFWQDCFFDGNSGAGDDKCRYHTQCLTGEKEQDDPDCGVSAACLEFCGARTPNGCDCFGCCTVNVGGTVADIQVDGSCSSENIDDEDACPRCTKSAECGNTCGTCELCPGKTVDDLPEECSPGSGGAGAGGSGGGPGYTCDGGEQVCGAGLPECEIGTYCALGCCIVYDVK